jgi:hypothetical protein
MLMNITMYDVLYNVHWFHLGGKISSLLSSFLSYITSTKYVLCDYEQ